MYRHVARAFVSRANANPTWVSGIPGLDLIDRMGSGYPLDGMAALDSLGACLQSAEEGSEPEPLVEIGLDRAVASFLADFEDFNRALDARAKPGSAERIEKPETATAGHAVTDESDAPERADEKQAPAVVETRRRSADIVKISAAAPHLRWDEPDADGPHLGRIKRAVALARLETQAKARTAPLGAQLAPREGRLGPAAEPHREASAEHRLALPPDLKAESTNEPVARSRLEPSLPARPVGGGSGRSIAALVGLASLLAGGAALWLAVARQTELKQLDATLGDQSQPVTTAAQVQGNREALQALAARMDRMRERIAVLENSTTDEGRDPEQAAALGARLAELEVAMKALKSLPASGSAEMAGPVATLPAAAKAPPGPVPMVPARPQ